MQVAHLEARLLQVIGEVLGHLLGERGHEHALAARGDLAAPSHEVVDLGRDGPHDDRRIDESGGSDDLLDDHASAVLQLIIAGVAEMKKVVGTIASNSANSSGRLSSALAAGSRAPPGRASAIGRRCTSRRSAEWWHGFVDEQQVVLGK